MDDQLVFEWMITNQLAAHPENYQLVDQQQVDPQRMDRQPSDDCQAVDRTARRANTIGAIAGNAQLDQQLGTSYHALRRCNLLLKCVSRQH